MMGACSSLPEPKKIIAVMGATGLQGGAVVRAFKELKESGNDSFEIRAITRNPESEKAKAIKSLVNEVVKADGDDEESMVNAFNGCYGAFVVTNYWADLDVKHEMKTTRIIQAAAKKANLKHVVLSTLEDSRKFVNKADNKDDWKVLGPDGMYVPHFDGKGEAAEKFAREVPTTKLLTCFYFENFLGAMAPVKHTESSPYTITLPMGEAELPMVSIKDIGKMVCFLLQNPSTIGKTHGIMSESLTLKEVAEIFTEICEAPVHYSHVPTEVFASFGFPGADDLANMFRFNKENETNFKASRIVPDDVKKKMGGLDNLADWVQANKEAFKITPAVSNFSMFQ